MLRIVRVLAPNASVHTLEGTNTWIVGDEPAIVIDPGPEDLPEHQEEVARTAGPVGAVLVTHDHPDHAPGAPAFAEAVGAPLFAFRLAGAEHLRDGQIVVAGRTTLTTIHTPGHTSDHVSFLERETGSLFAGDTVLGRGTSFIDPPDGDLARYLRSLGRLQELQPRTIYPGHGPVVLDGPGKVEEYLSHRQEREEQVLAALGDGTSTIDELVASIYAGYPPEVVPLAARSVLAHLIKLETEGRVEHSGSGEDAGYRAIVPRTCDRCGRRPAQGRSRYCGPCSLALLQDTADPA
jgi:glyoxylase-like metal-dependent hydrolase (beta-lactamase superfamily II)